LTLVTSLFAGCSSSNGGGASPSSSAAVSSEASASVSSSAEDLNATVIWRRFDDAFQSGFRIIMQSEANKMGGFKLDMQDGEDDPSKANNKLETALTKGAKSIAICAPDRKSTDEMMKKCKAENVPVVFFNMEPMPETMKAYDKVWYVGANAKESGQMCAQALINYWKNNKKIADKNGDGKLQLVILQGELGQQDVVLRTQAYEETLKEQGIDYEILAKDTANWDKAQAVDKMNTWITAYGIDKIEGVLCNSDGMAMGAVQAALDNGYNKGDANKFIPIVGIDATVEALQSMKNKALLGTVLNDRTSQSKAVLNVLKTVKSGGTISKDIVGVDCTVEGNYIWVPYKIVDQSNLEDTLKMMTELEGK
jgi:methyl-galactoside transport system substrate-binding protein